MIRVYVRAGASFFSFADQQVSRPGAGDCAWGAGLAPSWKFFGTRGSFAVAPYDGGLRAFFLLCG